MSHRGLEPRTTWLKVKCSTTWASGPYFLHIRCPEPESNQWHEDFQSSALPTELSGHWVAGAGFEPTTFGLWARRASRLLHPALFILYCMLTFQSLFLKSKWMGVDSNHRSNLQQIYSLSPLATRESTHLNKVYSVMHISMQKPMIGLEPITCWLQISCSANWATPANSINKFLQKWGL